MNNNKLLISESLADEDDGEESLLELLWNEGTLLTPLGISTPTAALLPPRGSSSRDVGPSSAGPQLFLEEDEMATWLHHCCNGEAAGGSDRIEEILETASTRARRCIDGNQAEEAATTTATMTTMTAVTDDDDACKVFEVGSARYSVPCTTTSSSSARVVITDQRKRKARSGKGFESNDQDAEIELGIKRKEAHQSAPTRKRASEVHNLSERRRRDRINEKMKTLRELIPRCNKSDKASMLDDAIEYLKSLQLQVQMMSSMQYNMSQIMFPGGPRYLQPMGFPIGGMQYPIMPVGPMMPHPPPIAGSSAANLPAQLMPAFHQANFVSNQQYPASSSNNTISSNMAQVPNFAAHQYAAVQHFQVPYQGQTVAEPGTSKETNNSRKSTDAR